MLRIFCLLSLMMLHAWALSYEDALKKAIREQKIVLVELVMESCPFCEQMDKYVLSKDDVKEKIDTNYIFIQLDIDKDMLPELLTSRMTPTFYFISSNGEKILHEIKGAPPKSSFIAQLDYVLTRNKGD